MLAVVGRGGTPTSPCLPRCRRCSRRAWTSWRAPSGACSRASYRGRGLPSGRRPGVGARPGGDDGPGVARPEGAGQTGPAAHSRRGRPPLPSHPDPGCRLQRASEDDPSATAPTLRRLARPEGTRARRGGRARRLSPRAGSCLPSSSVCPRTRAEGGGKAAPPGGRSTRGSPSGLRRRGDSAPARRSARARVGDRLRAGAGARRGSVLEGQVRRCAPARRSPRRTCVRRRELSRRAVCEGSCGPASSPLRSEWTWTTSPISSRRRFP